MEKSMFEIKAKEAVKPMEEICDKLVSCIKSEMEKGIECVDTKELSEAMDMVKDICEAKHYVVKALYDTEIGKAMEENADDYGETWDENGKYYTSMHPRSKMTGRYVRKGYTEPVHATYEMMDAKDVDMPRRMYYTENRDSREGRSGRSRMYYMESKEHHKANTSEDIKEKMKRLEEMMEDLKLDMKEVVKDMTPEEKTMWKTKLNGIANTL